jgi:hypothetical protein
MTNLFVIRRKADLAYFPNGYGEQKRSHVEFQPIGEPAILPPRTFKTNRDANVTLSRWLQGPVVHYYEFDEYEHKHDAKRGTRDNYEVIEVSLLPVATQSSQGREAEAISTASEGEVCSTCEQDNSAFFCSNGFHAGLQMPTIAASPKVASDTALKSK